MRADGFVPARMAAQELGITLAAIRVWAHRGILACGQSSDAAKIWIRFNPGDFERLGGEADTSGMERVRDIARRSGSSIDSVWDRVREREFSVYRVRRGRNRWDWQLALQTPAQAAASGSRLSSQARVTA
jgi:hypothetical protein